MKTSPRPHGTRPPAARTTARGARAQAPAPSGSGKNGGVFSPLRASKFFPKGASRAGATSRTPSSAASTCSGLQTPTTRLYSFSCEQASADRRGRAGYRGGAALQPRTRGAGRGRGRDGREGSGGGPRPLEPAEPHPARPDAARDVGHRIVPAPAARATDEAYARHHPDGTRGWNSAPTTTSPNPSPSVS